MVFKDHLNLFGVTNKPHCFLFFLWVFKEMEVPQNGWFNWFIMENPIKVADFRGTPILGNPHIGIFTINSRDWNGPIDH